jgi:hypothetical protein
MNKLDPIAVTALVLVAALAVLLPADAFAQGSGQINSVTTWAVSSIARPLINAGVVVVGALAVTGHLRWGIAVPLVVGGLIIANYQQIAGMFGGAA